MKLRLSRSSDVYRFGLAAAAGLGLIASPNLASAQISQHAIENFLMPGAPGAPWTLLLNTDYAYVDENTAFFKTYHNYARKFAPPGTSDFAPDDPSNVQYVMFYGKPNDRIEIGPYFAQYIPPGFQDGTTWRDGCGHAHFAYAIYGMVRHWTGTMYVDSYVFVGSEGRIGRRQMWINGGPRDVASGPQNPNAWCAILSAPPTVGNLHFPVWDNNGYATLQQGSTFLSLANGTYTVPAYFLVVQAATHGWGPAALESEWGATNCPDFLCYPDVGVESYKLYP